MSHSNVRRLEIKKWDGKKHEKRLTSIITAYYVTCHYLSKFRGTFQHHVFFCYDFFFRFFRVLVHTFNAPWKVFKIYSSKCKESGALRGQLQKDWIRTWNQLGEIVSSCRATTCRLDKTDNLPLPSRHATRLALAAVELSMAWTVILSLLVLFSVSQNLLVLSSFADHQNSYLVFM